VARLTPETTLRDRVLEAVLWLLLLLPVTLSGCFGAHRIKEIAENPYPVISQDESVARFGDSDDDVFIEVRKAKISKPLDQLAVHYGTLFPGGEVVRPGDTEEYVKVGNKTAYKVLFKRKYIRKRKRIVEGSEKPPEDTPRDWTSVTINDPETGKPVPVLYGPVIPRERALYLVAGDSEVYAVFLRADGDAIAPARKRFEKFVREEIQYR
jgi:hypothetical protein